MAGRGTDRKDGDFVLIKRGVAVAVARVISGTHAAPVWIEVCFICSKVLAVPGV